MRTSRATKPEGGPSVDSVASRSDPPTSDNGLEAGLQWLRAFELRHGRKLRVLHVGNVANNGYLTAKLLRRVGIEADALSYDYYHMMATPEWEEVNVRHSWGNDYNPTFDTRDLRGYQRPRWFVQGPMQLCARYLQERKVGSAKQEKTWEALERARTGDHAAQDEAAEWSEAIDATVGATGARQGWSKFRPWPAVALRLPYRVVRALWRLTIETLQRAGFHKAAATLIGYVAKSGIAPRLANVTIVPSLRLLPTSEYAHFKKLTEEFAELFPERADKLTLGDMVPYMQSVAEFKSLFAPYDIVQTYGVDPILPLIAGKQPYVGFEHGTLRDFVRGDNYMHRLTALGYRKAAHVFVTNGDCREHAEWLGIRNYSAMLHPIDVDQHEARDETAIAALRRSYKAELLLFCPVRHDWDVKGTDVHLRALPHIRKRLGRRVKLVLAPWGLQLEDSRRLIAELGCSDSVIWLDRALCRVALIRHMQAADIVLDQMALPHFGATAPQALAAGTPVVMSYRPDSTAWIVREPAPICVAFTPEEVADAVVQALDPAWLRDFKLRAKHWVHSHHHHHRLIVDHLQVYRNLVENLDDDGSGSPKGTI